MEVFLGIPAAPGTGIGKAFIIPEEIKRVVPQVKVSETEILDGCARFFNALKKVSSDISSQLSLLKDKKQNAVQREIFETYLMMLQDPVFLKEIQDFFQAEHYNIEYCIEFKANEYAARLRSSGNDYLSERAQDIIDIFGKVVNELLDFHPFDINQVPDGSIIIANSLSPTDTLVLSKKKILGLALTEGGVSSHVVILAKNFGIPAVVGINSVAISKKVKNGDRIVIDGESAEVLVEVEPEILSEYQKKYQEELNHAQKLRMFRDKNALTKDGVRFNIFANIGSLEEAQIALDEGADGIGLFRTEFIFMSEVENASYTSSRTFEEEKQFEIYKNVLTIMQGKPVTIRTLDAGGDKIVKTLDIPNFTEKNPLMGLRAIRLSLMYPYVFKIQIRALLRASVYGNLKIMLPLITTAEQIQETLAIIEEVKSELKAEKIPFKEDVPVGVMIETAAAAICSDCISKESDFFSIGTNDLTQYTLGVDRENSKVSELYDEFDLSVLRLIDFTVTNAKKAKIPLSVCGEMASREDSILVLGGMGVRNLSMSPKLISRAKELLLRFSIPEMESISSKNLNKL